MGDKIMFIEIINGQCTGAWSQTLQDWATFEIDKLPEKDLSFYNLVDGELVFDEKRKLELKRIDDDEKAKNDLQQYLKDTDWYVIRFMETGEEIPSEIAKQRQKARDKLSEIESGLL
jgi:hypothetical protein